MAYGRSAGWLAGCILKLGHIAGKSGGCKKPFWFNSSVFVRLLCPRVLDLPPIQLSLEAILALASEFQSQEDGLTDSAFSTCGRSFVDGRASQ